MKLITETVEDVKYLTEETDSGEKAFYLEGIIMQGEIVNRNGRMYPIETLIKEVHRYNSEYLMRNRAVGELGHPDGPNINSDRVSHKFVEIRQDGNNFIGKAKILNTPSGKIVQEFIKENIILGMSTRGVGSIKEINGVATVQGDFMLATAGDIVHDPSAPEAFVNGIMEGKEWVYANNTFKPQVIDNYKKILDNSGRQDKEKLAIKLLEDYLSKL